jgi:hypothetical protein
MTPQPSVAGTRGALWRPVRNNSAKRHPTLPLLAKHGGKIWNGKVGGRKSKPAAIAATAPVAVEVNGAVIGLALRLGKGFVFFSGGHRTDALDQRIFVSLAAIREAAGETAQPGAATPEAESRDGLGNATNDDLSVADGAKDESCSLAG